MFSKTAIAVALALPCVAIAAGEEPLRDPMRPAYKEASATRSVSTQRFSVSAIFVSQSRRVAVLNGRTVTIGDRVDGATVTAIDDQEVSLLYRGQRVSAELKLPRIRE